MSYSENGGAQQNGLRLPEPINQTATQSGRRALLQASATGNPYVDSTVELLCQGCNNSDAMVAALNSSVPSMLFSASGESWHSGNCHRYYALQCNKHAVVLVQDPTSPLHSSVSNFLFVPLVHELLVSGDKAYSGACLHPLMACVEDLAAVCMSTMLLQHSACMWYAYVFIYFVDHEHEAFPCIQLK